MADPQNVNEFLQIIIRSGAVPKADLDAHVGRIVTAGRMPTEPKPLADMLVAERVLTQFQASQFLRGRWRRFVLCGKYRLLRPIGSGGMGIVYLCEHLVMKRQVAIKVLPTTRSDPGAIERFHREARAVAALTHMNIVRAYDVDRDGPFHFLVMEYIEGQSLLDIVRSHGPLDITRACHYIAQSAQGLQHAHLAGIIHRDIKPSNLLLDRDGTIKLLDMGLAKFFDDKADELTRDHQPGAILGTADYLSPEQAVDSHNVDIRSDIYSLGLTFYFILTGRTPFEGSSVQQKLISHQWREPEPIRKFRPDVPEPLVAVVERMMAKELDKRFAMPMEVINALRPWTLAPIAPPGDLLTIPGQSDTIHPTPPLQRTPNTDLPKSTETQVGMMFADESNDGSENPTVVVSRPPEPERSWLLPAALGGLLIGTLMLAIIWYISSFPQPPPTNSVVNNAKTLQLLVPAYFYPAGPGLKQWERLIASAKEAPILAIVNPESGPGWKINPEYAAIITRANQAPLPMVGYISTRYGKRPLDEVKGDIDRWVNWYPEMRGFFLDEQSSQVDELGYYTALYDYARQRKPDALILTNPGTQCAEPYLSRPATDVVCLFETASGYDKFHLPSWTQRYTTDRFAALAPEVPDATTMRHFVRAAIDKRLGYLYITDRKGDNPWSELPSYWAEEIAAVREANLTR